MIIQLSILSVVLLSLRSADTQTSWFCWPDWASAEAPQPYQTCPGVTAEWVKYPHTSAEWHQTLTVTYRLNLSSQFYSWAFSQNLFDNAGPSKFRDAVAARSWCESATCPADVLEANRTNCCLHFINLYLCPGDKECRPWLPAYGSIRALSNRQAGSASTTEWTSSLDTSISLEGPGTLLAVIKVAGMMIGLEAKIDIRDKSECGNDACEFDETCDSCLEDCGFCSSELKLIVTILSVCLGLLVLFTVILLLLFYRRKRRRELADESWIVSVVDLVAGSALAISNYPSRTFDHERPAVVVVSVALLKGQMVAIKRYCNRNFQLTNQIRKEVRNVRVLDHPNICRFVGGTVDPGIIYILFEYCPKGSLLDVLLNDSIPLNWVFRFSFLTDIARGMSYIHRHGILHGNLNTSNCVLDDRWICKVTDYGLHEYRREQFDEDEDKEWAHRFLMKHQANQVYWAPEVFTKILPASDVYSFAIIMIEVAMRERVYKGSDHNPLSEMNWKPPLPKFRHSLVTEHDNPAHKMTESDYSSFTRNYHQLILRCWSDCPTDRPTFSAVESAVTSMNPYKRSPLDTMMDLMEIYSKNLELLVEKRSAQLLEEKRRTDNLLYSIMPRAVADKLKMGLTVQAEFFDNSSVFFSDIVQFTSLSARSTPLQVVNLLNKLYTTFDAVIEKYQVYKVETIGDCYMVVSGVPEKTASHAYNVATMALEIVAKSLEFRIPHFPEDRLSIRIGIASGPVCAGVVGVKMPRYCLFGDTVNTASRMESHSDAFRIHISQSTFDELQRHKNFVFERRGVIFVKGKGSMHTWWIIGMTEDSVSPVSQLESQLKLTVPKVHLEPRSKLPTYSDQLNSQSSLSIPKDQLESQPKLSITLGQSSSASTKAPYWQ